MSSDPRVLQFQADMRAAPTPVRVNTSPAPPVQGGRAEFDEPRYVHEQEISAARKILAGVGMGGRRRGLVVESKPPKGYHREGPFAWSKRSRSPFDWMRRRP